MPHAHIHALEDGIRDEEPHLGEPVADSQPRCHHHRDLRLLAVAIDITLPTSRCQHHYAADIVPATTNILSPHPNSDNGLHQLANETDRGSTPPHRPTLTTTTSSPATAIAITMFSPPLPLVPATILLCIPADAFKMQEPFDSFN
ncbi:hypothetical protein BD779DRAFT_1680379 [Infundibulicybe gibba]|nr:hypothetical protein BD779DRAFT_1680379 [Infundibulicybe gibba]